MTLIALGRASWLTDAPLLSTMIRFALLISVASVLVLMTSLSVLTWSPMSTNNSRLKLLRLLVFAPTSIASSLLERIPSISAFAFIPSMSSASTRCCLAQVPIGEWKSARIVLGCLFTLSNSSVYKLVCAVLGVSLTGLLPVSILARFSCPSAPRSRTRRLL